MKRIIASKKVTYTRYEQLVSRVERYLYDTYHADVWENFNDTTCYRLRMTKIGEIISNLYEFISSLGYDIWYADEYGDEVLSYTDHMVIGDTNYEYIVMYIDEDDSNSEDGYIFIDVDMIYTE